MEKHLIIAQLENEGEFVLAEQVRAAKLPLIKEYKKAVTHASKVIRNFIKNGMILSSMSESHKVGEITDRNTVLCVANLRFKLKAQYRKDPKKAIAILKKLGFRKLKAHYSKKVASHVRVKVALADTSDLSIVMAFTKAQAKKITGKSDIQMASKALLTIYRPVLKKDTVQGRLAKAKTIAPKIKKRKVVAQLNSFDKKMLVKGKHLKVILPKGKGNSLYTANLVAAKGKVKKFGKGTRVLDLKRLTTVAENKLDAFDTKMLSQGKYLKIILPNDMGEPLHTKDFNAAKEMAKYYGKGTRVVDLNKYQNGEYDSKVMRDLKKIM